MLYDPIYGAYTELYAGLSPDVNASHNGTYSKLSPFLHSLYPVIVAIDYAILLIMDTATSRAVGPSPSSAEERPRAFGEA